MQVEWASASIIWVEIDFVGLTEGVGLHEVSLVMHVEPVVGRVLFEIGNVSSDVNGGHGCTLPAARGFAVGDHI
jgi:hypothetical protein